jgi:hypothetical protein
MPDVPDQEKKDKGGLSFVDTVLIAGVVVAGVFVLLWVLRSVLGLALLAFKLAILVVVVAVVIRVVHLFTRSRD